MGKTTLCKQLKSATRKYYCSTHFRETGNVLEGVEGDIELEITVVNYDHMLKTHQNEYLDQNPGVEFHHCIDIIRARADAEYLDQLTMAMNQKFEKPNVRQLIYCDRNNTPDIWSDIKKVL